MMLVRIMNPAPASVTAAGSGNGRQDAKTLTLATMSERSPATDATLPVPRAAPPTTTPLSQPSPSAQAPDARTLTVPARFNGPPEAANGGWVAGRLAGILADRVGQGRVEVTLRRTTPLGVPLALEHTARGVRLTREDTTLVDARVVTEGQRTVLSFTGPPPPFVPPDLAARGAEEYVTLNPDGYRECVVCGPDRDPADGLRIFAWQVPDAPKGLVAALWRLQPWLATGEGVPDHFMWAALDCPTFWAHIAESAPAVTNALLVRQSVIVEKHLDRDETYVVVGRPDAARGRGLWGSGALYTADGELVAQARTMWMTL
jgi:hypothetical protein